MTYESTNNTEFRGNRNSTEWQLGESFAAYKFTTRDELRRAFHTYFQIGALEMMGHEDDEAHQQYLLWLWRQREDDIFEEWIGTYQEFAEVYREVARLYHGANLRRSICRN